MNKYRAEIDNRKTKMCALSAEGFSLIEVLIAMTIFVFIIGGIVMFSVNSIKANTRSQAMQEAMDNARYAMDDLAKKIRTSSNVSVQNGGKGIFFIDNKTLTKYCYVFDNATHSMLVQGVESIVGATSQESHFYNAIVDCGTMPLGTVGAIIGEGGDVAIDGTFEVMETDITDDDNPHRGFVRIVVDMVYNESGSPENRAEMHLQSGVSITDYGREDGFILDAVKETPSPAL
jgi:prepilin-type N-terminal cleavage/methylation domain-containing protein